MLSMMGVGALVATSSLIVLGARVVKGPYAIVAAFAYPAVLIGFALSRTFYLALAFLLLHEAPEPRTLAGAVLIVAAAILASRRPNVRA